MFYIGIRYFQGTCILEIFKMGPVEFHDLDPPGGILIPGFDKLCQSFHLLFHRLQVLHLQLQVECFYVANRIYRTVNMRKLFVIKTAQNLDQSIGVPYVRKEFVSNTFTLAGSLCQSRDIHDFNCGRDHLFGGLEIHQLIKPGVGYINHPHIRFVACKCKTGGFHLGIRHAIKKGGFTHICHPDDSAF